MTSITSKPKKRLPKLCTINCEWENCQSSMTLLPIEYKTFSEHIKLHADEFVSRLRSEAGDEGDKPISCCCMWRACSWEGCEDLIDLVRHIMFHGYHALLKALGELEQKKLNMNQCEIDIDDQYHMLSYVSGMPFICWWNGCNTEFVCPDKYYRHVEKHVTESSLIYDDKNELKMQCHWETCTNCFRDKHKLKEHVRVHTHEKVLACYGCGGLFSNRTKLLDHLSRQNMQAYENFQCSHCLKRCASERLLRDHMRHHVNYLKCPHCDMTCPNPGSLKYHIHYRHSDVRPFPCAMCEQSFKSNSDLVRHEESHLPKSYVCGEKGCNFSTKTAHCLRRHMKITHSESGLKRYVCHICHRGYSRGFGLTKHLKKEHNFSWPSGHPRFRYIEYEDGLFRLQMVRFESAELTKRLNRGGEDDDDDDDNYREEENASTVVVYEEEQDLQTEDHFANEEVMSDNIVHIDHNEVIELGSTVDVNIYRGCEGSDEQSHTDKLLNEKSPSTFKDKDIAIHSEVITPASTGDIYLQPKPPGYECSMMTQLMALSSKRNLKGSNTSLMSDLYQHLLKSNQRDKEDVIDEGINTNEKQYEEVVFEQVACRLDSVENKAINDNEFVSDVENKLIGDRYGTEHVLSPKDEKCFSFKLETISPEALTVKSHNVEERNINEIISQAEDILCREEVVSVDTLKSGRKRKSNSRINTRKNDNSKKRKQATKSGKKLLREFVASANCSKDESNLDEESFNNMNNDENINEMGDEEEMDQKLDVSHVLLSLTKST